MNMWRFFVIAFSLMLAQPALAAWWDPAWSYRLSFEASNTTGSTLTNQQFLLEIDGTDTNTGYTWSANGDDVRVVDAASGVAISYYIKSWDSGAETASILILVPTLNVGETRTVHLYYGNGAAAAASDPIAVLTESGLRYHTRNSTLDPTNRTEAVNEFNSLDDSVAGYGCTTVTNFTSINNRNLFSPPSRNSDIAFLSNHYFEVTAATAGTWQFRFGGDYGRGGGMYMDGSPVEEAWNDDLWWANNFNNTNETLEGSVTLGVGWHNLELIGFEGCCDGGTSVQFQSPAVPGTWRTWSTANIDIRSERCLTDSTPLQPTAADLSTSTHVASDQNGSDLEVGDVIRYTVTLTETGGAEAGDASVQLDVPAGVTGFTVISAPAGSTNNSSATGGANGNGVLDISGITVPANGSVAVVYEVTVDNVPGGTLIDVTATIDNPSGTGSLAIAANQLSVALASTPLSDVLKNLYFYDGDELSRVVPTTNQGNEFLFENGSTTWSLTPSLALPLTIDDNASQIRVWLFMRRYGSNNARDIDITIAGSSSGTIAAESFNGLTLTTAFTLYSFDVDVVGSPPATLGVGETIDITVRLGAGSGFRIIGIEPSNGTTHSYAEFPTDTAINIESVAIFDNAYPAGSAVATVNPGDTIYVRSEVSDPFGAFDITNAVVDIQDPGGASVAAGAMTEITSGGFPTASNKLYEFTYTLPGGAASGTWDVDVTAFEGTEGTVQHSVGTSFSIGGTASLEVDSGPVSASTCFPKAVTVRIVDGGGSPVTGYTGTVTLNTTSGNGGWQTGGSGTLIDTDLTDGVASYTFVSGDAGEATFSLTNARADNLRVVAADAVAGISDTSALVEFRDNRIQIVENDALDYDVIAGRSHAFQAQLWQRDTTSGNCSIATEYDGVYSLKAWLTRDGSDPGGAAPGLVGDSSLGAVPNAVPGSNNLDLDFSNGVASFVMTSSDVGKYSVNLRDGTSGFASDEGDSPLTIDSASTSAPYIVRPFALSVSAAGNPSATTSTGTRFASAGADFDVTVAGVLYDASDDNGAGGGTAGDGIADEISGLGNNGVAPSFGSEGETVTLSSSLTLPSGGANPGLAGDATLMNSFVSGQDTSTYQFNEVGIITISGAITDGNYLGAGATVTGRIATASVPIGRFVPDHFTVVASSNGSYRETCTAGATDFSYIGETFNYLLPPEFTVTPRDITGTITLSNYQNSFAHLTAGEITVGYPSSDAGNALTVTTSPNTGTLASNGDGTHTFTLDLLDDFQYQRTPAAQVAPFVSQLPIEVTAINETLDAVSGSGLPATANPTGTEHRYGRLNVRNAYGPETEALAVYSIVEYLTGAGWIANTADNCSNFSGGIATTPDSSPSGSFVNIPVGASTTNLTVLGPVAAGDGLLSFSSPGAGNIGEISVVVDLAALPWLQFDWDGDGIVETQLQRGAIFGQYRGHDRVIFWREIRN